MTTASPAYCCCFFVVIRKTYNCEGVQDSSGKHFFKCTNNEEEQKDGIRK